MASDSSSNTNKPNIWPWALVVGLLAGFVIGREMGPRHASTEEAAPAVAAAPAAAAPAAGEAAPAAPSRIYKAESEFPTGWMKSAELTGVKDLSWDGLTDPQKTMAMQAMNERNCECGCGMGSVAICAKKDPNCPRSPKMAKVVVDMARQGKNLTELLAYMDKENPKRGAAAAPSAEPQAGPKKVPVAAHSPRKGPKNAKVTIVAFSDFQCPFCSRVVPTLKEIHQKYPNDVAVVFVNQPLDFHAQARGAAKAFLAADKQGKGWEYHDKMFENQQALQVADLERYAKDLGLNVAKFKKDMDDPATEKLVAADQTLAGSVGANGTPTFFINGQELSGAQPFASFKTVIDAEIKKADELLKKGVKPADLYDRLMADAVANAPAAPPPGAPAAAAAPVKIDIGAAPVKGPKNAPVTVVAFSDFQCPFCSRAVPLLKEVEDKYKGKVRIAFKHLPLDFHANAKPAAEASMAANEQGKFWEYHDKLFENQQQLDRPSLEKYAQDLGLNMAKFKAAMDSGKFRKLVEEDARQAASVGANGTPTFFVNGKSIVGAKPFPEFAKDIDAALAAK